MKHLLLIAVAVTFIVILLVVWRLKSNMATTISLNAVKHPIAFYAVAIGVSVALVLATLYYVFWLRPEYGLDFVSSTLFVGIILSFAITSWVPDAAGRQRRIHRGAAYVAVVAMPLFLVSILVKIANVEISAFVMVSVVLQGAMLYLLLFVPKARRYFLPLQGLYLACFFISLFLLTYGVS